MYNNVIFDFYGTLVNIRTNEDEAFVWEKLSLYMAYQGAEYGAEDLKTSFDKVLDKYKARYSGSECPEVDVTDVIYRLYVDKGIKVKPKVVKNTSLFFRSLSTEYINVCEGAVPMLKELKKQGKNIYLLSNAQRVFLMAELKMLKLDKYFDGIYISSDLHTCKPDPMIFKELLKKEDLKKSDTVMVGSEYSTDIKGANKVGIDSVYFLSENSDKNAKKEDATYSILEGGHTKIIKVLTKG